METAEKIQPRMKAYMEAHGIDNPNRVEYHAYISWVNQKAYEFCIENRVNKVDTEERHRMFTEWLKNGGWRESE